MSETPERLGAAAPASPEKPRRSLDDIAAERAADLAGVEASQHEAVDFDARCARIGECLMDLYTSDDAAAAELEPYIDEGQFPEAAAQALAQYEAGKREKRPDFDITTKPPKLIQLALRKAMVVAEKEGRLAESETRTEAVEQVVDETSDDVARAEEAVDGMGEEKAEAATIDKRSSDEMAIASDIVDEAIERKEQKGSYLEFREANPDLKGLGLLRAVVSNDAQPEEERARASAFIRISELAQTESDVALITKKITSQDFSTGVPEPGAFIRHEIFSSGAHDTGFSEEMQEAVAKEFEIPRPPKADTGSEVRALATATTTDPETGEETPAYTEEYPAEFRPGVGAWSSDGEDVNLTVAIPGHPPVTREVTGWSNDDIGLLAEAMGFAAGLEQYGVTGFVEDVYKIDFNVLGDSAFDRESLRDIRQMISAMVGSFEGYDGDIFDVRDKIGLIRHQARLLSEEDTAYGTENSREDTLRSARKLGLRDENSELNFVVLKEFGRYAQETYLSEDATHADMQARLHGLFPQFVEAPEDDSAEENATPVADAA